MSGPPNEGSTAWGRTLEEANGMAAEMREEGWEVVVVRAGHVSPLPPEAGEDGRFGLLYVAPDDVAEDVPAIVERGEFDAYEVFRQRDGTDLFLLTRVVDADASLAVLLVGAVDLSGADRLLEVVRERGELYSHVRTLDKTHLATFYHEDPAHFFPEEL